MAEPKPVPPWLRAKVDQRMSLLRDAGGPEAFRSMGVVMTPVTEPPEGASDEEYEKWDRSCDSCGRYVPPLARFYTGHLVEMLGPVPIYMQFGICPECKERDERDA